ncbi:hypothetical protein IMZ31_22595 (plasmid) [Pontibacillus sp. ALD_SL1]|uniref:hypothetical protein n=1 Tax=Pontibacillus sp. ALD_SL1 TaxID=2777185 RepID=UPI001A9748D6|nr:hypothetical protein [Pontibacillus sp. ALD_SL1]QST02246.1 hypothetical protein IMZ31_22595 [Pontibacillus sp. ALD_SL1]
MMLIEVTHMRSPHDSIPQKKTVVRESLTDLFIELLKNETLRMLVDKGCSLDTEHRGEHELVIECSHDTLPLYGCWHLRMIKVLKKERNDSSTNLN